MVRTSETKPMAQKTKVQAKVRSVKPTAAKTSTSKAAAAAAAGSTSGARKATAASIPSSKASPAKATKAIADKAARKAANVKTESKKPVARSTVPAQAGPTVAAKAAFRAAGPARSAPVSARAVPAAVAKPSGQKLTAPVAPAPATPKAIAEKAAAARQAIAAQKKPVSQRHGFKTNEYIVYPAHGVGRIVGIEEQEIAGMSLELFVITFDKEKLTLRVPTGKLESVGMRKLADEGVVKKAMDTLKGRARVKRTMWSRRAQEYVAKINSGDLISIAEVVRDLYRSEAQPEQSYSERQLYEDALDRMAREIAAVEKLDERGAVQRITDVLSKSARGRRAAEGAEESAESEIKAA